ncbi:MAG: hypothetical protein Q8O40_13425 [Chloroflexota bacterium]|nr:hypothetical protein [Chloroflexota bacterium]
MATEQETQARLETLERRVRYLAWSWSREAPSAQEDLEQVARLAMWEELRRRPDAPDPHLLARAKRAIWKERLRGKSVDGRLNSTSRRPRAYSVYSLEASGPHDLPPIEDMVASGPARSHDPWESPTEGEAVGHVLYEELQPLLTDTQELFLTLIMCGYQSQEAGQLLGMTKQQAWLVRLSIQRVACEVLGLEYPGLPPRGRRYRSAALASWVRRRPPVPPDVKRLILSLFDVLLD